MREMKNAYKIFGRKRVGKGPFRRPRCRWEDNTETDPREIGWAGVDWMHLAKYRD
jgi:hypothetical protein